MADATTAAKDRVERALAALERKVLDLKASARPEDDDLFAGPYSRVDHDPRAEDRIAVLEAAGRDATVALAQAATALRTVLGEAEPAVGAPATDPDDVTPSTLSDAG